MHLIAKASRLKFTLYALKGTISYLRKAILCHILHLLAESAFNGTAQMSFSLKVKASMHRCAEWSSAAAVRYIPYFTRDQMSLLMRPY